MTHLAWVIAGFLLGAILGSFVATLCLRWPEGRSVTSGRSTCDGCGKVIPARDLVPLVSALLSGGRARCCGTRIDPLHARVEWIAALVGAASLAIAPSLQGLALALFGWLLLPLVVLDAHHFWLPNRLVLLLAVAGAVLGSVVSGSGLAERLLTAAIAGLGLAAIGLAYRSLRKREGLGAGDPKLFAAIALWLGPQLTVASLLGAALLGLAEALLRRRGPSEAQPFGAFLGCAAWLVAAAYILRA